MHPNPNPDAGVSKGLGDACLKSRFKRGCGIEFHKIVPVWDLRPEVLPFNIVVADALVGAELFLADRESFLSHCIDAEIYCSGAYKKYSGGSQIQIVAEQWLRGEALTPPLFFLNSHGKLEKVDGHHRTTVAFLTESPIFPFYCQQTLNLQGVERASSEHLTQSRWIANSGL
jgi:hypothetical protein